MNISDIWMKGLQKRTEAMIKKFGGQRDGLSIYEKIERNILKVLNTLFCISETAVF